jgi:hypothetical protein
MYDDPAGVVTNGTPPLRLRTASGIPIGSPHRPAARSVRGIRTCRIGIVVDHSPLHYRALGLRGNSPQLCSTRRIPMPYPINPVFPRRHSRAASSLSAFSNALDTSRIHSMILGFTRRLSYFSFLPFAGISFFASKCLDGLRTHSTLSTTLDRSRSRLAHSCASLSVRVGRSKQITFPITWYFALVTLRTFGPSLVVVNAPVHQDPIED